MGFGAGVTGPGWGPAGFEGCSCFRGVAVLDLGQAPLTHVERVLASRAKRRLSLCNTESSRKGFRSHEPQAGKGVALLRIWPLGPAGRSSEPPPSQFGGNAVSRLADQPAPNGSWTQTGRTAITCLTRTLSSDAGNFNLSPPPPPQKILSPLPPNRKGYIPTSARLTDQ